MFNRGRIEDEFNSHRIVAVGWGVNDIYDVIRWYWYELINNNDRNGNSIGASGACSIGEGLKVNSTLKELDLGMRI